MTIMSNLPPFRQTSCFMWDRKFLFFFCLHSLIIIFERYVLQYANTVWFSNEHKKQLGNSFKSFHGRLKPKISVTTFMCKAEWHLQYDEHIAINPIVRCPHNQWFKLPNFHLFQHLGKKQNACLNSWADIGCLKIRKTEAENQSFSFVRKTNRFPSMPHLSAKVL